MLDQLIIWQSLVGNFNHCWGKNMFKWEKLIPKEKKAAVEEKFAVRKGHTFGPTFFVKETL